MKMSDVFTLPVETQAGLDPHLVVETDLLELFGSQAKAAAHAINTHDELVSMLEYLQDHYFSTARSAITNNAEKHIFDSCQSDIKDLIGRANNA